MAADGYALRQRYSHGKISEREMKPRENKMKEIKFTVGYEPVLSFSDKNFKKKYEERVGNNAAYTQVVGGDRKHLALCPRCNNPVVILGIYKKIEVAPHARHTKGIDIPGVVCYNEYKFEHCPYHRKKANYVKEYVPETEEPQRQELYKIAKKHFDKAVYLLEKKTGIHITPAMAEALSENYAAVRGYNYIDATVYNIPWYFVYCYDGFPLYHMIIKKNSTLHKHLIQLGFVLRDSKMKGCMFVGNNEGYLLRATDYRYVVNENEEINEWLDFSILKPDPDVTETVLYIPVDRFHVSVDSYYFGNLINYEKWKTRQNMLDIAEKYMNP